MLFVQRLKTYQRLELRTGLAVLLSSSAGSEFQEVTLLGNHHLPSTGGNKGCLHINILPEQH